MSLSRSDIDLQLTTVKKFLKGWSLIYPKPHLNYQSGPLCSMPPRIDPKNWTPITSEELKAHQERQTLRGQLRREYWMKAYHPVNYKYFYPHCEKQIVRFGYLKSVWHIKESVSLSNGAAMKALLGFAVLVGAHLMWGLKMRPRQPSIIERLENTPE